MLNELSDHLSLLFVNRSHFLFNIRKTKIKTYLFKYLSQAKHRNYSINKNHYNILANLIIISYNILVKLTYKVTYKSTYSIYVKPYLNKLTKHTYTDEFHSDLNSRFTEFSWLNNKDYQKYQTILIKARNHAHDLS